METTIETIRHNIATIEERIELAAKRSGRNSEDVKLVVVSKTKPVEVMQAAINAGVKIFGENYPEETQKKIVDLGASKDYEWHMIGHLQSRKASIVAEHFHFVHSIDRLSIAQKLDQCCGERKKRLPILLEVNVSGEESKSGWSAYRDEQLAELFSEFEQVLALKNLEVRGLMTMPPLYQDPEMTRPYFKVLRRLQDQLRHKFPDNPFNELSMGTSSDFEVAVEEGATFVRIGQAILGPRAPRKP